MLIPQQLNNDNVYKPLSSQKKTQAKSQSCSLFFEARELF